ncbi:MAG: DNA repair protein RecO [Candidatus Cloacimonadia bacterium]
MANRIEKCNAFALRIVNYSDTSQIVKFFSDKFGHLDVIAKGSRNPKSPYYGALQPLAEYEIVIYKKETTLSLLKELSIIQDSFGLIDNLEKSACAFAGGELYLQLLFETHEYKKFYDLFKQYTAYLQRINKNFIVIFWRFLLRILVLLGYSIQLKQCTICKERNPKKFYGLSFVREGIICVTCAQKNSTKNILKCSQECIDLLTSLKTIGEKLDSLQLSPSLIKEINTVLRLYLEYHLHHKIHLRSLDIYHNFNTYKT